MPADLRRLHPRLTETDLDSTPFVPELSPVVQPHGDGLMTRPWLDWARRLTLLVKVKGSGGSESDPTHVVGPGSATADAIALYSGTTGKLIKDSFKTIAQVIADAVSQAIAAILPGGTLPVSNLPVHHARHEPGGSDQIVNVAWTNQANNFSQSQTIERSIPGLFLVENDQPVNTKTWEMMVESQRLYLFPLTDAGISINNGLTLDRNGDATVTGNLLGAANVARRDTANTFTVAPQVIQLDHPILKQTHPSAPANQRSWHLDTDGLTYHIQPLTDVGTPILSSLTLTRGGDVAAGRDVFEKGRTTPLGHWLDVPFNAANFAASSGAWTVTAGNVIVNKYTRIGTTLIWSVKLDNTTVTGGPAELYMTLPIAAPGAIVGEGATPMALAFDGAAAPAHAYLINSSGIVIKKNAGGGWASSLYLYFTMTVDVY